MSSSINSVMSTKVWILLLTLSVVWGGSFFFNAILVSELPPLTIVFFRVALAALFLWVYIFAKRIPIPKSKFVWSSFALMGLLNNVVPFGLIVWGQTVISSSLASILNATVPLMTVVLAAVLLSDENISLRKIAGVVIGFVGTVWIIAPTGQAFGFDNLLAQLAILVASLSYSLASIFGRRFRTMQVNPVTTAAGQVTMSALIMLPIMLIVDKPYLLALPSTKIIIAMLALALVSTAMAYILYFKILADAGATNLMLVTFLIPAWAMLLGFLLLGDQLSANQVQGMLVIAIGLSLIDGRIWHRSKWSLKNEKKR